MTAAPSLEIFCVGWDNARQPTHDRKTLAHLAIDPATNLLVQLPTAQQRGNPKATRPRAVAGKRATTCPECGDPLPPSTKLLRKCVLRAVAAGRADCDVHLLADLAR